MYRELPLYGISHMMGPAKSNHSLGDNGRGVNYAKGRLQRWPRHVVPHAFFRPLDEKAPDEGLCFDGRPQS